MARRAIQQQRGRKRWRGPYTYAASGLPAGLTLNPATGAITGTPTAAGSFSVTWTVTDSSAPPLVIDVAATLVITAASTPGASISAVPTLGEWSLALLGLLMTGIAVRQRSGARTKGG